MLICLERSDSHSRSFVLSKIPDPEIFLTLWIYETVRACMINKKFWVHNLLKCLQKMFFKFCKNYIIDFLTPYNMYYMYCTVLYVSEVLLHFLKNQLNFRITRYRWKKCYWTGILQNIGCLHTDTQWVKDNKIGLTFTKNKNWTTRIV